MQGVGQSDRRFGAGHGEERTWNMLLMSVTPEVSQLERSAVKFFKPSKSLLIWVMAETSQSAMRPYVAVAAVGLALNAWTAVFKKAVLVKVPGGEGGCTTKDLVPW